MDSHEARLRIARAAVIAGGVILLVALIVVCALAGLSFFMAGVIESLLNVFGAK